ncbi:hypothetical protein PspLS_07813 [Pyricularia sp. CBS 133598]|nr:hypothetical protein PspLS_07813 [Pyricularia sp. CBS 133598]
MHYANAFAVLPSITHVNSVRQVSPSMASECSSIISSAEATALPKKPGKLISALSVVKTDPCYYIRPPVQTSAADEFGSMLDDWNNQVREWLKTSSNAALDQSIWSRCDAYATSTAFSRESAYASCMSEIATMGSNTAIPTTAAETGSSVTPAGAATPTPTTPGAGARSGVSTALVAGAVLVGGFLVL